MLKDTINLTRAVCLVLIVMWAGTGCGNTPDASRGVATRYELEKSMWTAEQLRKRAVSDPFSERPEDLRAAAAVYEEILSSERFQRAAVQGSEVSIGADLRRLLLKCKIARAELHFVELEAYAGVTYPATIGDPHDLLFTRRFGLRLTRVKGLYGQEEGDSLETRCAEAFESVAEDSLLWMGGAELGDTLLATPVALARIQIDRGASRERDHGRRAESFYTRIIGTWPEAPVADGARVHRAELYVFEGRFDEAIRDLDDLLQSPRANVSRSDLLLWRGEILAHGLHRDDEARRALSTVASEFPRRAAARRAMVSLAQLEARRGREEEAARMLRGLELDPATPRPTWAAAVSVRAQQLAKGGDWLEAVQLMWDVCRLEPSTQAAAVSPLEIIRHYVEARDSAAVAKSLEQAAEFYCDAIAKTAGDPTRSYVLVDYLIEGYLLAERPIAAAELLEELAPGWRGEKGCVGLYKGALIYLRLVHDKENGIRMLQKCLDAFPSSGYAWMVRAELDRLSPTGSAP